VINIASASDDSPARIGNAKCGTVTIFHPIAAREFNKYWISRLLHI
jgi:hypothetical protein